MGVSACKTSKYQFQCERDGCGIGGTAPKGTSRVNISRQAYELPQGEELIAEGGIHQEESLSLQQLHGQLAAIKTHGVKQDASTGGGFNQVSNGCVREPDAKAELKKKAAGNLLRALKSGELHEKAEDAARHSVTNGGDPNLSNTTTKTGKSDGSAESSPEMQDISPANVDVNIEEEAADAGSFDQDSEGFVQSDPPERPPGPPPHDSSAETGENGHGLTRVSSPGSGKLKAAVKKAMLAHDVGGKVAMENKIGCKLDGFLREVALALQIGISIEGRCETPPPGFRAPEAEMFSRARMAAGFPPARYYATMGLQDGRMDPTLVQVGSSDAAGKSGAFFLLSPDQQLIAKSCTNEDWHTLLKILPGYVTFMEAARSRAEAKQSMGRRSNSGPDLTTAPAGNSGNNGSARNVDTGRVRGFTETLLPRFLGLYSVQVAEQPKPVRVLVMANVFGGQLTINRRYDLKGSTHGRKASNKELGKKQPVYKDLDWKANEESLGLGDVNIVHIMETLRQDAQFLDKHMLMDYSLLVGVHVIGESEGDVREVMNVVTVKDETRHCYIGIIDVLTPYRVRKRAETFALGTAFCGRDISCQHPRVYARRFIEFCESYVFAT